MVAIAIKKEINPIAVRLCANSFKVSDCSLIAPHDDGLVTDLINRSL
jgi:hypothetical protein